MKRTLSIFSLLRKRESLSAEELAETVRTVSLPTIKGIQPIQYMPYVLCANILVVIWAIIMLPGIVHYGSMVHITANGHELSVYIDEVRVGATPYTQFLPVGNYTVRVAAPYYSEYTTEITVTGRRFFSLFRPLRYFLAISATIVDIDGFIDEASEAFARMSLMQRSTRQYYLAPILSQTMYALQSHVLDIEEKRNIETALLQAFAQISSYELWTEYMHAFAWYFGYDGIVNEHSLAALFQFISPHIMPFELPRWFSQLQPSEQKIVQQLYELSQSHKPVQTIPIVFDDSNDSVVEVATIALQAVQPFFAMRYMWYVQTNEVSVGQFVRFLQEQPQWDVRNDDALFQQKLVDEQYLEGIAVTTQNAMYNTFPIRMVSYYAIQAYIAWLNTKLDGQYRDYVFMLPSSQVWLALAQANDALFAPHSVLYAEHDMQSMWYHEAHNNARGIQHMWGNVWELTQSWYYNGDIAVDIPSDRYAQAYFQIKGGSVVTQALDSKNSAIHNPIWSSPYVGFRVLLVHKNDVLHMKI